MQLKMKTLAATTAVAVAAALGVAPAFAQTKAAPAKAAAPVAMPKTAKVNGVVIPSAYFDAMNREREASGQPANAEIGNAIKEELVNREVLTQAAKKKGIDKDATVSAQMEMAKQAVLIRAFFEDHVKANPITDAQLKGDYEKFVAQMGDKEYKARHILVDTEDEAKAVLASLGKGDSFEKVAKEKTKDTGSKDNGGDLDWGPAGRYVPEFGNALKALKKGETTKAAVKSPFGFHVIRLDDVRDMKVPGFDEVKDNFRQRAQQEQVAKLVQELRSKASVE
jgi:peptidyl-prolyl cis-trans isomerase C